MASSTVQRSDSGQMALSDSVVKGVVAGLVGGAIFGVQMATMQMLPMVAQMIGSQSPVVGFFVHMLISAVIGGVYGVIASRLPSSWLVIAAAGAIYGVIWWVLGALVIMPLVLGMGGMVLQIGDMQWMSLIGHLIFGIVMAVLYRLIADRS
jgi:uncharacterized membrane protein YagU involved in acid resistance